MTDTVIKMLRENSIKIIRVPANMTNLFHLLDLTVNGSAKAYMRRRFTEWYSTSISRQLNEGKAVDNIEFELKLFILDPLHAG